MALSSLNSCKISDLKYNVASENILCYKIFQIKDNKYYGPFTEFEFGEIRPDMILTPTLVSNIRHNKFPALFRRMLDHKILYHFLGDVHYNVFEGWWEVKSGYLHTLPYCPDKLEHYCPWWGHFELWECIIPKGTIYFQADRRGSHYEANNSYASKELKLIKKISEIDS